MKVHFLISLLTVSLVFACQKKEEIIQNTFDIKGQWVVTKTEKISTGEIQSWEKYHGVHSIQFVFSFYANAVIFSDSQYQFGYLTKDSEDPFTKGYDFTLDGDEITFEFSTLTKKGTIMESNSRNLIIKYSEEDIIYYFEKVE